MVKKTLLLLSMLALMVQAGAQLKRAIKKGRRNKAESRFMLDGGEFQAEWETGIETVSKTLSTYVYPNLTLHYGISNRLEVNTEVSMLTARDQSTPLHKNLSGLEPVMIGANYLVLKETGNSPAIIFSGQLAIPFLAGVHFKADRYAPVFQLSVQQAFGQRITAGLTPGLFWDGFSPSPSFTYNGTVSCKCAEHWLVTTECFGFINPSPPQHNIDANIAYLKNDEVQFGFTSGIGLSKAAHKSYFALNGTWGFKTARKNKPVAL